MDIEGIGPETIDVLVRNGLVRGRRRTCTPSIRGSSSTCPASGRRRSPRSGRASRRAGSQPFHIVFPSLGIPDIGQKVTELLIEAGYRDIDSPPRAWRTRATRPRSWQIHGIGERTAETLLRELGARPRCAAGSNGCARPGVQARRGSALGAASDVPQTFAGQTWCVTGTLRELHPAGEGNGGGARAGAGR